MHEILIMILRLAAIAAVGILIAGCSPTGDREPPTVNTEPTDAPPENARPGGVAGIIDGHEFRWPIPRPNTDSCSNYRGSIRVDFLSPEGNSSVKMLNTAVEVRIDGQYDYFASAIGIGHEKFKTHLTIDGNVIQYAGPMKRTAAGQKTGSDVTTVEAVITARCD